MLHAAPVTRQQRKVTALVGCSLCSFVVLRGDGKTWPCGASGFAVFKRPPSSSNVHRFHVLSATVVVYRPPFSCFIGQSCRVLSATVFAFLSATGVAFHQAPLSCFIDHRMRVNIGYIPRSRITLMRRPALLPASRSTALPVTAVSRHSLLSCHIATPEGGWGRRHGRIRPADGQQPVRRRPHHAASALRRP